MIMKSPAAATTTSLSSKAGVDDGVVYYSSFDLRAKIWAGGGTSGGVVNIEDALLREVAEESMEREFTVIEESCQRQYVLMMLFRDLQFTKWISDKLRPGNSNRTLPVESTSASHKRPPIPIAPSAQPL